ncbi:hypothetical protein EYF80_009972 [Liparis tanakae]|uniref:Uncharacterized protein n=1 Tax=Liparis tanakae TaxID=230148 RepID=A0A4Z2INY7_9TELE|nr:hypothetical protein EYF80_009972 [Liparis tanakae]
MPRQSCVNTGSTVVITAGSDETLCLRVRGEVCYLYCTVCAVCVSGKERSARDGRRKREQCVECLRSIYLKELRWWNHTIGFLAPCDHLLREKCLEEEEVEEEEDRDKRRQTETDREKWKNLPSDPECFPHGGRRQQLRNAMLQRQPRGSDPGLRTGELAGLQSSGKGLGMAGRDDVLRSSSCNLLDTGNKKTRQQPQEPRVSRVANIPISLFSGGARTPPLTLKSACWKLHFAFGEIFLKACRVAVSQVPASDQWCKSVVNDRTAVPPVESTAILHTGLDMPSYWIERRLWANVDCCYAIVNKEAAGIKILFPGDAPRSTAADPERMASSIASLAKAGFVGVLAPGCTTVQGLPWGKAGGGGGGAIMGGGGGGGGGGGVKTGGEVPRQIPIWGCGLGVDHGRVLALYHALRGSVTLVGQAAATAAAAQRHGLLLGFRANTVSDVVASGLNLAAVLLAFSDSSTLWLDLLIEDWTCTDPLAVLLAFSDSSTLWLDLFTVDWTRTDPLAVLLLRVLQ